MGSWPRWALASPPRACGQSSAGMASIPLPVDPGPLGRSSSEPRRPPCWPATSSPSTRCCSAVSTCCSSSRSTLEGSTSLASPRTQQGVGHSAGAQPHLRSSRALPTSEVPHPGPRHEIHRQFRRGVPHRGHQSHQDAHSIPSRQCVRRAFRRHRSSECLDRMLVFHPRHLEQVLSEFAHHYNENRPHRSLGQRAPLTVGKRPLPITIRIRTNYDGETNSAVSFTSTDSRHELLGWDFRHEQAFSLGREALSLLGSCRQATRPCPL